MLKRSLLAQILLVTFAVPVVVFAEENEPSPGKPSALIVREGSLCNYSTLGVSEDGSQITLRALWNPRVYSCFAGQYVAASTESVEVADCPKDSYCPGLTDYTFSDTDSEESRGRYACAEGFHTDSTGSTGQQDCYKTETVACSVKNPYTTEHMISVKYSTENTICMQRQGSEATCDSSCEITGLVCEEGYDAYNIKGVWSCVGDYVECASGTYLSHVTQECETCKENHFCSGGSYRLSEAQEQDLGIEPCKDNLKSPAGTVSEKDCGIIFRIGGDALYMHGDRRDTDHPAFVIQDSKGKLWYAPLESVGENRENVKPVSDGATKELHVMFNGEEYTVHTSLYEGE